MKKQKSLNVTIKVPTSLKDISLSQYQKFVRVTKDKEDVNWINRQVVGIFCNLPDHIVKNIRKKDFDSILQGVSKVLKQEPPLKLLVNHNGELYGFIPDLENITVGEQADLEEMIGDWEKMDKAMGILYRKVKLKKGDKYLIEDYTSKEEPLDLTMDIVTGAMVFFYNLLKDLEIATQNYIRVEALKQMSKTSQENGGGFKTFGRWLRCQFSDTKRMSLKSN